MIRFGNTSAEDVNDEIKKTHFSVLFLVCCLSRDHDEAYAMNRFLLHAPPTQLK